MRRLKVPSHFGPLSFPMFLLALMAFAPALHAQNAPEYLLCRYQGQKEAHPITYVAPIIHSSAPIGEIGGRFRKYVETTYDVSKVRYPISYCRQVSSSADQQAFTMDTLEKQWAASKTEVIRVNWTDTPGQVAETNARVASAAAGPAGAANEQYVVCASGRDGPVVYFSEIFPTGMAPPPAGHKTGNGWGIASASGKFQNSFFVFLQKTYGFKSGSNYPVECGPTSGKFQDAQRYKQGLEDLARQNKAKVVETGWKDQ